MKLIELTENDIAALNESFSQIDPIEVEVGTKHYDITAIECSLWEKKGRRLYLNLTFSWEDSRYQFEGVWINLETGGYFEGRNGMFVDSGKKRDSAKAAKNGLVKRVLQAIASLGVAA